MDISHKVPKGLFEHTGLWHGITLGQMFVLAGALMFQFMIIMATGGPSTAKLIIVGSDLAALFFVMKVSNMKGRGKLKEAAVYALTSPFQPKRYSG